MQKLLIAAGIGAAIGTIGWSSINLTANNLLCRYKSSGADFICKVWNAPGAVIDGIWKGSLLGAGAGVLLVAGLKIKWTPNTLTNLSLLALTLAIWSHNRASIAHTKSSDKMEKAFAFTRRWEGGNTDHPLDPGGRTGSGGVLQGEYDTYRASKGLPARDVFKISDSEIRDIYLGYWNRGGCGNFPDPLSLACFDSYINFAPNTASGFLQNLPGDPVPAAHTVVERRKAFRYLRVQENPSQSAFLNGWLARDMDLDKVIDGGG